MTIRCGGSCGGRYSRPIVGTTCYENRILQNDEHKYFWQDSKFCIDNGIFLIVNIDSYLTNGRWRPSNQELRDFTIDTKNELKYMGMTKKNGRLSYDNESGEYTSFDLYMNGVRVVHDALDGDFDLGAGNFRTTQMGWYNGIAMLGGFEVLDMHFQDGMTSKSLIASVAAKFPDYPRRAVTEGNNFWNVSTSSGHDLLKYQIEIADQMGCEDFCFPFCNWTANTVEGHSGMAYCVNDKQISNYWPDMLNLIKVKKPITKRSVNSMIIKTIGHKETDVKSGYGVLLLKEVLNLHGYLDEADINFVYDAKCRTALEAFQTAVQPKYNNTVDGRCGRMMWRYLLKEIPDVSDRKEFTDDFYIIMSPYNINGDT